MEHHFHLGIEHVLLGALGVAVVFHGGRMLGAFLGSQNNTIVSTVGNSIGGFFTFNGASS